MQLHSCVCAMSNQLGPFEVGQIKAHMEHDLGCIAIQKKIFRRDGKTTFSETAVVDAMNKLKSHTPLGEETPAVRIRGLFSCGASRPGIGQA